MAKKSARTIGGYEILQEIGRGAMGVVFKARQIAMDRVVALKFLPSDMSQDAKLVQRFEREARAAGKLNHPNIVAVHDVGSVDGKHYISMEFVDGQSTYDRVKKQGPFSEKDAIEIGLQIAGALQIAHRNNILHRDVKPDNFLMDKHGRFCLADLGLARFERDKKDAHLTQEGSAVGTPHYMAPEQARGKGVDARSDLYGLGASLYVLATGETPYEGPNATAIMVKAATEPHRPLRDAGPNLSDGFVSVIEKLMEKDQADRYQSADELIGAFNQLKSGEVPKRLKGRGATTSRQKAITKRQARIGTDRQVPITSRPARMGTDRQVPISGRPSRSGTDRQVPVGGRPKATRVGSSSSSSSSTLLAIAGVGVGALLLFLLFGSSGSSRRTPRKKKTSSAPQTNVDFQRHNAAALRKSAAAKKAFDKLAALHNEKLASNPAPLIGEWERYLKAHGDAARKKDAETRLAKARAAAEGLKKKWEELKASVDGKERATAMRELSAFIQAHEGSAEAGEANTKLGEVTGKFMEWARGHMRKASDAAREGKSDEATALLNEVKTASQSLPPTKQQALDLDSAFAAVQRQAAAAKEREQTAAAEEEKFLATAHQKAEKAVRERAPGFSFGEAVMAYRDAAKQMKGSGGKAAAEQWAKRFALAGQLWESAGKANFKKARVMLDDFAGHKKVRISGWKGMKLYFDPPRLPPGQQTSLKILTADHAVQLVQWTIHVDAPPKEQLKLALFAYAVGAFEVAVARLAPFCGLEGEHKKLAEAPLIRARKELDATREKKAEACLAQAKQAQGKNSPNDVTAALKPIAAGGALAGTQFAKARAAEVAALQKWVQDAAARIAAAEKKKKEEEEQKKKEGLAGVDSRQDLQRMGWRVAGTWKKDPDNPNRVVAKDGTLTRMNKNIRLDLKFKLREGAKLAVYVRHDNEAVATFLNSLPLAAAGLKDQLPYIAPGYGLEAEGEKVKVFGPGNPLGALGGFGGGGRRGGRGGRRGGGGWLGAPSNLPMESTSWPLTKGEHTICVQINIQDLTVKMDNEAFRHKGQLRNHGEVVIKITGTAELLLPQSNR